LDSLEPVAGSTLQSGQLFTLVPSAFVSIFIMPAPPAIGLGPGAANGRILPFFEPAHRHQVEKCPENPSPPPHATLGPAESNFLSVKFDAITITVSLNFSYTTVIDESSIAQAADDVVEAVKQDNIRYIANDIIRLTR
jgi:hypothetical protein